MRKKIVFFVGAMGRGGAERVVSILSQHYVNKGWDVSIGMILHNNSDYTLDARVKVIDFSYSDSFIFLRIIKMFKAVRIYIKEESPNVVVPFLAKISAIIYLILLGNHDNYRLIVSERIDPYQVHNSLILKWLISISFMKADCVVFQTKRAKSYYNTKIQDKSVIIGNPVSINIANMDRHDKTIVNAGRLTEQKNQKMLIEAFSMLAKKYPDYKLCIYGEGKLRKELTRYINDDKLTNQVFLPGNLIDYEDKLSNAEIFVLSSNYEGLSNALLEAMMMGIPCISTNCAGSSEVIVNGENGIIVPLGDSAKLSCEIEKVLNDRKLQIKLGKNARTTALKFKTENVIREWEKVFEGF